MLEKVKECLGITGTYQDTILKNWIAINGFKLYQKLKYIWEY